MCHSSRVRPVPGSDPGWWLFVVLAGCVFLSTFPVTGSRAAVAGFVGWTLPLGDLDDISDAGVHGGASLTTPLVPGLLEGGPLLVYHDLAGLSPGDDVTITELLGQLRLSLPTGPTLMLAAGIASPTATVEGHDLAWDDRFDMVLGAGIRFILLDLQARWHHLEDLDALAVSAGLRF